MHVSPWVWALFGFLVLSALALDLGLLHAKGGGQRQLTLRAAAVRNGAWVALALLFGLGVFAVYGQGAALTYLTAYLLEQSLSIDNVFVFVLIFSELRIPAAQQRSVLLWGVLGALVMRALAHRRRIDPAQPVPLGRLPFRRAHNFRGRSLVVGQAERAGAGGRRVLDLQHMGGATIPITPQYHGGSFVVRQAERGGRLVATPLLVALIIIETTDIVFALDSVPAVLAITRDPFIVYTSNIFAMLGLRSLYFVLAGVVDRFRFLRVGLAVILIFFGARLLLGDILEVPTEVSLGVIAAGLALSVAASIKWPGANIRPAPSG